MPHESQIVLHLHCGLLIICELWMLVLYIYGQISESRSIHTGYIELETKCFGRFDINKLLFFVCLFLLV